MSLDKYSTVYFLTVDGWIEKPIFKGQKSEIIEEWDVSVVQPSIKSIDVTWTQSGATAPENVALAAHLKQKFPRPEDRTF